MSLIVHKITYVCNVQRLMPTLYHTHVFRWCHERMFYVSRECLWITQPTLWSIRETYDCSRESVFSLVLEVTLYKLHAPRTRGQFKSHAWWRPVAASSRYDTVLMTVENSRCADGICFSDLFLRGLYQTIKMAPQSPGLCCDRVLMI